MCEKKSDKEKSDALAEASIKVITENETILTIKESTNNGIVQVNYKALSN